MGLVKTTKNRSPAPKTPDFGALVDAFELSLLAKRRSPKTIRAYIDTARRYGAFCQARRREPIRSERADVEAFIVDQLARHTASTAATRFRCLQQFFAWLVADSEIITSPMAKMTAPTLEEKLVPIIDEAHMKRLRATCSTDAFVDLRDLAIIGFLADTGARLAELVGLRTTDIDLKGLTAVVTGKGSRDRRVYFTAATGATLDRYRRKARGQHPLAGESAFWLGHRGIMTDSGIAQAIEKRGLEAGLGRVHAHQFRHTFAHAMKASGMPDDEVMALAGWRSPQMLARYGASARSQRAEASYRRITDGSP